MEKAIGRLGQSPGSAQFLAFMFLFIVKIFKFRQPSQERRNGLRTDRAIR